MFQCPERTAGRHQQVHVRMLRERLTPGVQGREHPRHPAE
jgi:hypothetical protein